MNTPETGHGLLLKQIMDIGVALSREKDNKVLLEMIVTRAQELTHADAATLYECRDDGLLHFEIMQTRSLGIHLGGRGNKPVELPPLSMFDENGEPNRKLVATWVATSKITVMIDDVYHDKAFDFSGTYLWDKKIGYRSQSFLAVPMVNHLDEVIGVLQLINAQDRNGQTIPFSGLDRDIAESLASQAAVSITNRKLIEAQKKLFDSLIQLIANAIDEKSHYTAGHCLRVPVITRLLADAVCRIDKGPLKDFSLSDDEKYELDVAAWLHDCGKITTPEYVVDKATKLETITDRIHLVEARFDILKRDAIIASLRRQLTDKAPDPELQARLQEIEDERAFIRESNIGKERLGEAERERIHRIAHERRLELDGKEISVLSDDELVNLDIDRGTLSIRERGIINNHVSVTLQMLQALPYPKNLARVPEFAGSHHEKMDGTGYPRGLTREQMPLQSRMIAIADVFEALTASDRPYKKAMPLSQCLAILGQMKLDGHIDPDLFDVFIHEKLYLVYARDYLNPASIDIDDARHIPGYHDLDAS